MIQFMMVCSARCAAQAPLGAEHLRLPRQAFEEHARRLDFSEGELERASELFEAHKRNYASIVSAWVAAQKWLTSCYPDMYGGRDLESNRTLRSYELSLAGNWQRSARELLTTYFDGLADIKPGAEDTVIKLRREHFHRRVLAAAGLFDRAPPGSQLYLPDLLEDEASGADAVLTSYRDALDPILIELDGLLWQYQPQHLSDLRGLRALRGQVGDESRQAEAFVRMWGRPYELCWMIRALNIRTLEELGLQTDASRIGEANAAAMPRLYPFIVTAPKDSSLASDLQRTVGDGDLSEDTRRDVEQLLLRFTVQRDLAIRTIEPLYARVAGPEWYMVVAHAWVDRALFDESYSDAPNNVAEARFDEATHAWAAEIRSLRAEFKQLMESE